MRFLIFALACLFLAALPSPAAAQADCKITNTCPPPPPKAKARPAPAPSPPPVRAAPRADPCDARWQTASRSGTLDDYEGFAATCPRHRNTELAHSRTADLRCEGHWENAVFDGTLDGFETVLTKCPNHARAAAAREQADYFRANPTDIAELNKLCCTVPDQGLSADSQALARNCETGTGLACVTLAERFRTGNGAPASELWATAMYAAGCVFDNAIGCGNLSVHLVEGKGVKKDRARAAILAERACAMGEQNGCNSLGSMYFNGEGVPRNYTKAMELFERGCAEGKAGGSADACLNAANLYDRGAEVAFGSIPKDASRALRFAEAGLRLAPADAELIALRNRLSPGAANLYAPALSSDNQRLYAQCNTGSAAACTSLGSAYYQGKGAPQDNDFAFVHFEKACSANHALGCFELAKLLQQSRGPARDDKRAEALFERACKGGIALACSSLSTIRKGL